METFDYIVIGAGSAGCVVAARLSERADTSVLLLEAGGRIRTSRCKMPVAFLKAVINPAFNWGYMTEPEPCLGGRRLWLPRGRVLGGSGSINGMFYMRGHPSDYDDWERMGATGWGYDERAAVLPEDGNELARRGGSITAPRVPIHVRPIDTTHLVHEPLDVRGDGRGLQQQR